jgi:hypothetical protein
MFQILIIPSNSSANAALFYHTKEKAESVFQNIHGMLKGTIEVDMIMQHDDFGVKIMIPLDSVSYVLFGDINKQNELIALQGGVKK